MTTDDILWGDGPFEKRKVDGRILPKRCAEIWYFAIQCGFSHPLGRALYIINRKHNGNLPSYFPGKPEDADFLEWRLDRIKESTAIRWRKHWKSGGRIKRL